MYDPSVPLYQLAFLALPRIRFGATVARLEADSAYGRPRPRHSTANLLRQMHAAPRALYALRSAFPTRVHSARVVDLGSYPPSPPFARAPAAFRMASCESARAAEDPPFSQPSAWCGPRCPAARSRCVNGVARLGGRWPSSRWHVGSRCAGSLACTGQPRRVDGLWSA